MLGNDLSKGPRRRAVSSALVAACLGAALFAGAADAGAQATSTPSTVSPTGKGTVGGGLLGGEVVCITLGAVGVEKGWPYLAFGGVGAVGGAIGGYVVDSTGKTNGVAEPSLYMLAGGMALFIPALIVSLNATAFHPPETTETKEPIDNQAVPNPPRPTAKRAHPRVAAHVPVSAVDFYKGELALGLPAVAVNPLYTQREIAQFGVQQGKEVNFPVFRAMF